MLINKEKQTGVISALAEGASIGSVHRDTDHASRCARWRSVRRVNAVDWRVPMVDYSHRSNGRSDPFRFKLGHHTTNPHPICIQTGRLVKRLCLALVLFGSTVPGSVGSGPLLNVSTRLQVGTADRVLIGGLIVDGDGTKKLMLRAIGPSLLQAGVTDPLADPTLELHDSSGAIIATNDNWQTTQIGGIITSDQVTDIRASTLAPSHPAESAIIATLDPGSYTVIVRGVNNTTGIGLVEVYDLEESSPAKLANISTRGFVQTADNAMIGGFIVGTPDSPKVIIRALGPSLAASGVTDVLADPTLELHDGNGALIASNDNWADTQQTEIEATGLVPPDPREAAIVWTVTPGNYTAIVTGKAGTIGVGLVEVYKIQ